MFKVLTPAALPSIDSPSPSHPAAAHCSLLLLDFPDNNTRIILPSKVLHGHWGDGVALNTWSNSRKVFGGHGPLALVHGPDAVVRQIHGMTLWTESLRSG